MTIPPRLRAAIPALIGLALFLAALEILRSQLRALTWAALVADVFDTPAGQLGAAALLTALSYTILTAYDLLAFASIGKRLDPRRVMTASFLAYAISNNVGFGMLAGASVRYRFYTRWGVTASELSRVIFSYVVTFWLGLLLVGGVSLALSALPSMSGGPFAGVWGPAGWAVALLSVAYVAAAALGLGPVRLWRLELPLPSARIAAAQLGVSVLDWLVAASVLFVLLPPGRVPFVTLVAAFLGAQLVATASHVPGGVGVFEGLMVLLLQPSLPAPALLPALIVYRAIYYLVPLTTALLLLVADELQLRRSQAARATAALGWFVGQLTPRLLAAFTFLAGAVLLLSGATPAAAGRLRWLDRLLPLGVIEVSHFAGSIVGACLLLLSQGLARRLDAAYFLTVIGIVVGIAASLLKGADVEEAVLLAALLLVLWRERPAFDRRAALFDTRFSAGWIASVAGVLGATAGIGLFAFKHVEYSTELWWQFEVQGEVSRVLRASVGAAITVLLFAVARLMSHAPHEAEPPDDAELEAAGRILAGQTSTTPYLVYLRDKALQFDEQRSAFVMYGVRGRTWVALGDPVGPPDRMDAMIRLFLERCDDFGGIPVFYEISSDYLHHYADVGLTFVKLGEEARVDLRAFTTEGGHGRKYRQALARLEKTGAAFRVLPPEEVERMLPQLQAVSDDWLAARATAEKGFSLGFFRPDYIRRFPVAVVEQDGRILAFANLWPGPGGVELSLDLMRFERGAPRDVMESLFVHVMLWAKARGYQWLPLGMAPLSGFERSPVAPLWSRLASFVYEHGEAIYNFQGLRAYKEKFDPTWRPRYLAYPGGLRLPRVLADVAALIAGGYGRIFLK